MQEFNTTGLMHSTYGNPKPAIRHTEIPKEEENENVIELGDDSEYIGPTAREFVDDLR